MASWPTTEAKGRDKSHSPISVKAPRTPSAAWQGSRLGILGTRPLAAHADACGYVARLRSADNCTYGS
jgi:hypothetical protein